MTEERKPVKCPIGLEHFNAICSAGYCDVCVEARKTDAANDPSKLLKIGPRPEGSIKLRPAFKNVLDEGARLFNTLIMKTHGRKCDHTALPPVPFDPVRARGMTSSEVRALWPRLTRVCPECMESVTMYASFEHYTSGDW